MKVNDVTAGAPNRVMMAGSVPLAAPWNGADKNLARMLVLHDTTNQYILRTSSQEPWPEHVRPLRTARIDTMPTNRAKLGALTDILRFSNGTDLLHIVASLRAPNRFGVAAMKTWSRLHGLPVVHTVPSAGDHAVNIRHFPGTVTVVVSEQTRRTLLELGVQNVVRVLPPLDTSVLIPTANGEELARSLRLGTRAILYPAHFGEQSGMAEAVQALAALPPELSDAVLVIAARAHRHQNPAEEAARIEALAAAAGVAERVRVVGHIADMHALIEACAVTALVPGKLASKMDLPLVVLESLALGRPVILGDRPPLTEALLGGGLSVPYGDVPALTRAFVHLLANQDARATFAATGRAAVLERCNSVRVVQQYHDVYRWALELAASRSVAPAGVRNI